MTHEFPSRRNLLIASGPIAAAGVGFALAGEYSTNTFNRFDPDKSLDALYNPKNLSEHMTFLQRVRTDATTIAQGYVVAPTDLPVQGLAQAEFQPSVNTRAIVEAMLLMAQDAYGQAGRDWVKTQLQQRGLNISVGQYSAPEKKGTTDTRYQLPLPGTMVGAHLTYEGENASKNVDDFPVLTAANNLVTMIINEGIAPDNSSVNAQMANVGIGLAGGALVVGVAEPLPRSAFLGIAGAGLAGSLVASEIFKWGPGAVHAANTALVGSKSVGSGYDKMGDFNDLAQTELFKTDIRGQLIVQHRTK